MEMKERSVKTMAQSENSIFDSSDLKARETDIALESVELTNLYTKSTGSSITTSIYANGRMQIRLYPTINYSSSDSSEEEIRKYVIDNIKLYELDDLNEGHEVTWSRSDVSNEWDHDINELDRNSSNMSKELHGYRVPIYITPPLVLALENINGTQS